MGDTAIARRLDSMKATGALCATDVANILDVQPDTVLRWRRGEELPPPMTEKQLSELAFVVEQLAEFYPPREARRWMFSRQRVLNGDVPAELIQKGRVDDVLTVVNELRDNVHL